MRVTIRLPKFSRNQAKRIVEHTRNVIVGREQDQFQIGIRFWSAVGSSLFDSIFRAFVTKSNHGTDELGASWKDHSPKYKAYGRPDARDGLSLYDNRAVNTPSLRVRPTLPPSVNRQWAGRWFGMYVSMQGVGDREAKASAGASTWEHFKAKGFPTLIQLTGEKKLPILNRKGVLQKSLFPWPLQGGIYIPFDENQIFRQRNGELEIGTRFEYANELDKDRPLWPENIDLWIERAVEAGSKSLFDYLPQVVEHIR